MSCKESAIFFTNLAYIPHIKQNHSTSTKICLKTLISTEEFPQWFYPICQSKLNFVAVSFEVTDLLRLPKRNRWVKNGEFLSEKKSQTSNYSTIDHFSIQSVLIGVKYWNYCWTYYLLFIYFLLFGWGKCNQNWFTYL